jgi:hypothetical protein
MVGPTEAGVVTTTTAPHAQSIYIEKKSFEIEHDIGYSYLLDNR